MANDPIHQFQISKLIPIQIGGVDLSFTNSSLAMVLTLVVGGGFLAWASKPAALVRGRLQSVAEMAYSFVASTLRSSAGKEGMKFFPLVFSLFMFVLVANFLGLIPYLFTATSAIIVTFALAMLVILTVVIYGFWRHGLKFLGLFVPHGVPIAIVPIVTTIEVISFLSRPDQPLHSSLR